VVSIGKDKRYGHTNQEVVNILEKNSKNSFYTDKDVNITFSTDGTNLDFINKNKSRFYRIYFLC